jgi:hypothetical protein
VQLVQGTPTTTDAARGSQVARASSAAAPPVELDLRFTADAAPLTADLMLEPGRQRRPAARGPWRAASSAPGRREHRRRGDCGSAAGHPGSDRVAC